MTAFMQFGRYGAELVRTEPGQFMVGHRPSNRMIVGQVAGEDDVTVAGWSLSASQADANAGRQQFVGHMDNRWEPQVPWRWGTDSSQDGYMVPIDGEFSSVVGTSYLAQGSYGFQFRLKAKKLRGWTAPRFLSTFGGTWLSNDHGVSTSGPTPWHALSGHATAYDFAGRGDVPDGRFGDGAGSPYVNMWNPGGSYYFTSHAKWGIAPVNYYDMASTIMVGGYATAGAQVPSAGNEANWLLANQLIKIGPGTGSGNTFAFTSVQYAAPPIYYGMTHQIQLGWDSGGVWYPINPSAITGIAVRRNSPEWCILRVYLQTAPNANTAQSFVTVDLGLRRGARTVTVVIQSPGVKKWGLKTGLAMTPFSSPVEGLRANADDADGNRILLHQAQTNTQDTTHGILYLSSAATRTTMGLSTEFGGGSAAAPDDYATVNSNFFAAQTEYVKAVSP